MSRTRRQDAEPGQLEHTLTVGKLHVNHMYLILQLMLGIYHMFVCQFRYICIPYHFQ